jgi:hypothetical protein
MYWVGEGNMVIRSDRLQEMGGFGAKYREHDIRPLAFYARAHSLTNWYEPGLAVTHKNINVRPGGRLFRILMVDILLSRTYGGILGWFLPMFTRWK